jgi:hypothetical protein
MATFFEKANGIIIDGLGTVVNENRRALLVNHANTSAALQQAGDEFDEATGQEGPDGATAKVGEGMIRFINKLTAGSGNLSDGDRAEIKDIAAQVVDLTDDGAEAALENFIGALVDHVNSTKQLVNDENATPPVELARARAGNTRSKKGK